MSNRWRIGIVGANAAGSWAAYAHMPALAALSGIEVAALATSRAESARASAAAFGVAEGHGSVADLLKSDVEMVAVSVKAPDHAVVVRQVLEAGKHLFVEWPMGANLSEAEAMVDLAERQGLRAFVGLQARAAPPARHAAKLIADGFLGRLHSVSVFGSYAYWGDPVQAGYSADVACGANILTIPGGHGLDLMRMLAGDVAELNGRTSNLRDMVMAADLGHEVPMTAPDQFAAIGTLRSGAVFSAHFAGTAPRGETFRIELVGEKGELSIEADGMPEVAPLRLSGVAGKGMERAAIEVPAEDDGAPLAGPAYNVWHLWKLIAADMANGTSLAPSLHTGLETRRMIDAIARSAKAAGAVTSAA